MYRIRCRADATGRKGDKMNKSMIASMVAVAATILVGTTGAEARFCQEGLRSRNSDTPVTVTFVNRSGEFRSVMWLDFKGKRVQYADLNPGQSFTINTFVTHPWMFTDGPGNCVEMFLPRVGLSKYNITLPSSGEGGD